MEKDWNQLQSKTIDVLRFPMVAAVVLLHHAYTLMDSSSATVSALCVLFHGILCRLSVPFFFFIAGYLFFSKLERWDWGVWKTKLERRIWTLLVPYILWNVIAFFAYWGYARIFGEPATFASQFERYGGLRMFLGINGGIPLGHRDFPINGPLWFMRDLMYFALMTPAIYVFLRYTKVYGVLLLIAGHLAVEGVVHEGFVFFVGGSFLRLENRNIVQMVLPWRKMLYGVSILLVVVLFYLYGHSSPYWVRFFKFFFLIAGIGASFCLAADLVQKGGVRTGSFLGHSSFFVYALHMVILPREYSHEILDAIYPFSGEAGEIIGFFLIPALLVVLCVAILWLLERWLPRVACVLTGNRTAKQLITLSQEGKPEKK